MEPTTRRLAPLLALITLAGCGGGHPAVPVTVPTPTAGTQCAALTAALPDKLDGRARRTTAPASDLVVAWGSPAVVLRCGVVAVHSSAGDHVTFDGVSWRTPGPVNGLVVWTTTDRQTTVELSVPEAVNNQETLLGELAPAVTGSLSRVPGPASASPAVTATAG